MCNAAVPGVRLLFIHDVCGGHRRALVQGHILLLARLPTPPTFVSTFCHEMVCASGLSSTLSDNQCPRPAVTRQEDDSLSTWPVLSSALHRGAFNWCPPQSQAPAGEGVLRGDGVLPVGHRHAGVLGDAPQGLLGHDDAPLCDARAHRTVIPPQVSGPAACTQLYVDMHQWISRYVCLRARAAVGLLTVHIAGMQLHEGGLHDPAAARRVRRPDGGGQDVQVLQAGGVLSLYVW
jgi:hypothetical protein